jgi:hypothetical protein
MTYLGIFKSNALQKSFTETWHSKSKASIQSKRSNVNAKVGFLEVDVILPRKQKQLRMGKT